MLATQKTILGDFQIQYLGIDSPSYFPGYGTAFTPFRFCAYGIGDTEEEALEDCLEMMAQSAGFRFRRSNGATYPGRIRRLRHNHGCRCAGVVGRGNRRSFG